MIGSQYIQYASNTFQTIAPTYATCYIQYANNTFQTIVTIYAPHEQKMKLSNLRVVLLACGMSV